MQEGNVELKEEDGTPQVAKPAIIETDQTTHGSTTLLDKSTGSRTTSIAYSMYKILSEFGTSESSLAGPVVAGSHFSVKYLIWYHQ